MNPASIPGTPRGWTRGLLCCGGAAGPVFVAVLLLEGAVRDGYRPPRHPVSSLALGPRGWIQAANFAAAGTLFLAAAAGLARAGDPAASRAAPALIGAAGAGLIGAAVFTTDPASGYPPGTPDALTHPTRTGMAHNLAAVPVFAGLPAATLASGRRSWRPGERRFGLYSAGTGVTMLTTMALASAGFGQSPRLANLGGLFQRASIITGFAWLTALSARALRRKPATAASRHQPPLFNADGQLEVWCLACACELGFRVLAGWGRLHLMGAGRSAGAGCRGRARPRLLVYGRRAPWFWEITGFHTHVIPGTGALFAMEHNGWDRALKVTGGGTGLIGHAGAVLLRKAADQAGLTAGLGAALRKAGMSPVWDRGIVLVSMAAAIAPGATSMSDIAVLAHLAPVLGAAPSGPTVRRALDLAGTPAMLDRIARARAKARAHAWALIEDTVSGFPWLVIAGKTLTGWVVIDLDATLVTAHSDKEGAAPTWKKGYGLLTELPEASSQFRGCVAWVWATVPAHG